ncbi:ParA family protein [Azospirillum sp. RWY-5-1]|uniref:ParA family protein n=1 Tax=Azospirillum oleiclasticum TaxID=2735135 RepID=A0ABX2TN94_9PROT|nr:ParA family protein [Azospirillum oleiclasticum]NYZ17980.1 ParA family protein [Azospirillum oleiclasticum]NYZ25145.1 ParA family protein [Azospirillum oleiclasticum]
MHIIVLASAKGGVGKTTLAAHLAVAAEVAGDGPAVLIDADPQASLAEWWNVRAAETPAFASTTLASLAGDLERLAAAGVKLAVIDTPPSATEHIREVVALGSFVLIPVKPSPHDLRAVGRTVELVEAGGRPFGFVVTMAKTNAKLTTQAIAALSEHGVVAPAIIVDRVDYAASMTDGRTVQELAPKGPAAKEAAALWDFVKARLHGNTKARKRVKTILD